MSGVPFSGAVLTGGSSRRMGADKALIDVDGRPLAVRVADALRAAGAEEVVAVGGDVDGLRRAGLDAQPDGYPGEGPLGGILTALGAATADLVAVLSCDLVSPDPAAVRALVRALEPSTADAAVAVSDGRREPLVAAYRRAVAPALAAAFAAGERSPSRVLDGLVVVEVAVERAVVRDTDRPEDLRPS